MFIIVVICENVKGQCTHGKFDPEHKDFTHSVYAPKQSQTLDAYKACLPIHLCCSSSVKFLFKI